MILPDFVLPPRVNQCWKYSGIDSFEECLDKNHFEQYPYPITYNYNSRGFRDQEWPDSIEELKNAVWCMGDSFTVGLGSPVEHTWPSLLQKQTGRRVINVSLDGASNNWIARKTVDVLQQINPQHVVVHWSYVHRREFDVSTAFDKKWNNFYQAIKDPQWPPCDTPAEFDYLPEYIKQEINNEHGGIPVLNDEDRRCHSLPYATSDDDLSNLLECIESTTHAFLTTQLLHSFIPNFCQTSTKVLQYLEQHQIDYIPEFKIIDWARDRHHYDILTSQLFVNQITNWLNRENYL
jgi:hypothetical protein